MEIERDVFLVLVGATIPQVGSILRQLVEYWLKKRFAALEQERQARDEAKKLERKRLTHDVESTDPEDLSKKLSAYRTPSGGLLSRVEEIELNWAKRLYEWLLGLHRE